MDPVVLNLRDKASEPHMSRQLGASAPVARPRHTSSRGVWHGAGCRTRTAHEGGAGQHPAGLRAAPWAAGRRSGTRRSRRRPRRR